MNAVALEVTRLLEQLPEESDVHDTMYLWALESKFQEWEKEAHLSKFICYSGR